MTVLARGIGLLIPDHRTDILIRASRWPCSFAYGGWSYGLQQALVFDPAADPAPILAALGRGLDWRRRTLPKGARLLFGSGHDGCSAVVASENRDWLDRFRAALG